MPLRIGLAWLIGLIAALAVVMGAWRSEELWPRTVLVVLAVGMLGYGVLGGLFGRGRTRRFWTGFALFGGLMLWMSDQGGTIFSPGDQPSPRLGLQGARKPAGADLYLQIVMLVDRLTLPDFPARMQRDVRMRDFFAEQAKALEARGTASGPQGVKELEELKRALSYFEEIDKRHVRIEVMRWVVVMLAGIVGGSIAAARFGESERGGRL